MNYRFLMQMGGFAIGLGSNPHEVTQAVKSSANIIAAPQPLLHKPQDVSIRFHPIMEKSIRNRKVTTMRGGQVIVVLGLTGSGKSTMMEEILISEGIGTKKIVFGEPEGIMLSTPSLLQEIGLAMDDLIVRNKYAYSPLSLGEKPAEVPVLESMLGYTSQPADEVGIITIDSLRKFFYAPSQSTGSGGVNNEMFMLLTELSVFARTTGLTFVVALNPLLDDEDKMMGLASRVAGSVDTTILLKGQPADTGVLSAMITSRYWEDRAWVPASMTKPALAKVMRSNDARRETIDNNDFGPDTHTLTQFIE